MGIQPIDLQVLYTQMEKVGKQVATEQKANEEANVKEAESFNRALQEQQATVQETKEYEKLNVNKDGKNDADLSSKKKPPEKDPKQHQEKDKAYFTDPDLGRKIDFSR